MSGETDLKILLGSMDPVLGTEDFIFCTIDEPIERIVELKPWAIIREAEGYTAIITKEAAESNGIRFSSVFSRITLNIHSSLDAVGLTAAVSTKLARSGISANVVAAYYHDHIFVKKEKAQAALEALRELVKVCPDALPGRTF
jgi:hypothetical protein